jgi:hypothetical protein
MKATAARHLAKRILAETHFAKVKAFRAFWGDGWEINIDGGKAACYGRTLTTEEDAEDLIRIHAEDLIRIHAEEATA